jgi:hypothetical protein
MTYREELERRISQLASLDRRPSRHGDGFSYFVAEREIAHFHGDDRFDVRLTKLEIRQRRADGSLDRRVRTGGPQAEWVAVSILAARDIALALELLECAIRANA